MRRRSAALAVIGLFSVLVILGGVAQASTLSWGAVTKYTDGTNIPTSKTITYRTYTGTSASNVNTPGPTTTSLSATVTTPAAGQTLYYTVSAEVDAVEGGKAVPVSLTVPFKTPTAPAGLQVN